MGKGSSGKKGIPYGTEYKTLHEFENVKFVRYLKGNNASAPDVTRTPNRIYAVINAKDEVKFIVFFDENIKMYQQIDVSGKPHYNSGVRVDPPHLHKGGTHKGADVLERPKWDAKTRETFDKIIKEWYNFKRKQ